MIHAAPSLPFIKIQLRQSPRLLVMVIILGIVLSITLAYLAAVGNWLFALALLAAVPAFVILHRYPFAGLMIWLVLTPFVVATDGGALRKVFWVIHRGLPLAVLGIIVLSAALKTHPRQLPRLGWPEMAMAGYLLFSVLSILYFSPSVNATLTDLYDRIFIPMCLYLLVRLTNPGEKEMRLLLPILVFILLTQSVIGLLSWTAPQVLPPAWLNRIGLRTTGSLRSYSVFTSTIMFCGLLILQSALNVRPTRYIKQVSVVLFILAVFMVFLSFSRGSWLAGTLVVIGLIGIYPRFMLRLALTVTPILLVLIGLGILDNQISWASQRFYSEESAEAALSRLPVFYASYRMFEARPVFGWGYGNFDAFDRQFQERVGDLIDPVKDHASHNLYLTLLAEQGVIGTFLFLAPMFWWLALTIRALPRMPTEGLWSRNLVLILWLVIVFHIIVNNFSNMRVVFGLGIWWITLGLIAALVWPYAKGNQDRTDLNQEVR